MKVNPDKWRKADFQQDCPNGNKPPSPIFSQKSVPKKGKEKNVSNQPTPEHDVVTQLNINDSHDESHAIIERQKY
jgi:hypothetical protein